MPTNGEVLNEIKRKADKADIDEALTLKSNTADVYSKMQVDSALSNKVSKSGDTLSGNLKFSKPFSTIDNNNPDAQIALRAGTIAEAGQGSALYLCGEENTWKSGAFSLMAGSPNRNYKYLDGYADGRLIWGGSQIKTDAHVLTIEEIEASTDLSGKVVSASALKGAFRKLTNHTDNSTLEMFENYGSNNAIYRQAVFAVSRKDNGEIVDGDTLPFWVNDRQSCFVFVSQSGKTSAFDNMGAGYVNDNAIRIDIRMTTQPIRVMYIFKFH